MTELTTEIISTKIFEIRGQNVMLDRDLAALYGVTTGNLNKSMKRNIKKFPQDFMFQLTKDEALIISRFQNGTLKQGHNVKYLPYVFTEYGAMQS